VSKPTKPVVSVEVKDLLALLDAEEQKQLAAALSAGTDALEDSVDPFSGVSLTLLLREILVLRMPFVRMLNELVELLQYIEASVQGNVEFIVIPDGHREFKLAVGPQMREKVAKAIDASRLIQGAARIEDCFRTLSLCTTSLINVIKPKRVRKSDPLVEARRRAQSLLPSHLAERARIQNEFLSDNLEHDVYVYQTGDEQAMRALVDELREAKVLCERLIASSKQAPSIDAIVSALQRLIHDGIGKANRMARSRDGNRHSQRNPEVAQHFSRCHESLTAFKEALFAASDFADGTENLKDFFTFNFWKKRWRIYELWVLAHVVNLLKRQGARVSDCSRVQNGRWTLKYGKDKKPILKLSTNAKELEIYYQYFQDSENGGDMPDIAVKIANGGFALVIDPKHGYRGRDSELRRVATNYANQFKPLLSCAVNYFDKSPAFEELCASTRAVVLWGVVPGGKSTPQFDQEVLDTLRKAGCALTEQTTIVVLFDISRSARGARDRLVAALREDLAILTTTLTHESRLLLFGNSIVHDLVLGEGRLETLAEVPDDDGTDFDLAFGESVARVCDKPLPRQVWLFTDGDGAVNIETVSAMLQQNMIHLSVVEAGISVPSVLAQLSERVGGEHRYLHRGLL
jgi:hypothetical protein